MCWLNVKMKNNLKVDLWKSWNRKTEESTALFSWSTEKWYWGEEILLRIERFTSVVLIICSDIERCFGKMMWGWVWRWSYFNFTDIWRVESWRMSQLAKSQYIQVCIMCHFRQRTRHMPVDSRWDASYSRGCETLRQWVWWCWKMQR